MTNISFEVSVFLPAPPEIVYHAWLNSQEHIRMTGGEAHISAEVGETFDAWDGYIQGCNLELEPFRRIVQTWRTAEFNDADDDSNIEILLEPKNGGTLLILIHTNLPANGMQYKQGWVDNYFEPMKAYFLEQSSPKI